MGRKKILTRKYDRPRVAVMVETSRGYARDILHGILRYAMLHGPWELHAVPGGREEQLIPVMPHFGKKGIIAHITTPHMADDIVAMELPTVSVFPTGDISFPAKKIKHYGEVRFDSDATGNMGAIFLLERRFPYYGFVGELYDADWSLIRCNAFSKTISDAGFPLFVYETPLSDERDWITDQKRLCKWLKNLPKPIGIMAATDIRGRDVIDACHKMQITIPDDISILGVDNDELFCKMTSPGLSSVSIDAEKAGYESAAILDQLMQGRQRKMIACFGPLCVIPRRSTDVFLVDDKLVCDAIEYIQMNFKRQIGVPDVLRELCVSRRLLELRFKNVLGYSISEAIKKRRLNHVKFLLLETDFTLDKIAEQCGFNSKNYLINVFRKEFGMTMMSFRFSKKI